MNCTENQTKESDSRMNPSLIIGIGQHVSHDTQTKKSLLDYYFSKSFNKKGKQTLECKLRAKKRQSHQNLKLLHRKVSLTA